MATLVNDIKEKLEISRSTITILEKTISVITGDKRPEEREEKSEIEVDSVFKDLDTLTKNMIRILKDVEVLNSAVCGSETTCNPR